MYVDVQLLQGLLVLDSSSSQRRSLHFIINRPHVSLLLPSSYSLNFTCAR